MKNQRKKSCWSPIQWFHGRYFSFLICTRLRQEIYLDSISPLSFHDPFVFIVFLSIPFIIYYPVSLIFFYRRFLIFFIWCFFDKFSFIVYFFFLYLLCSFIFFSDICCRAILLDPFLTRSFYGLPSFVVVLPIPLNYLLTRTWWFFFDHWCLFLFYAFSFFFVCSSYYCFVSFSSIFLWYISLFFHKLFLRSSQIITFLLFSFILLSCSSLLFLQFFSLIFYFLFHQHFISL